MPAGLHMIRVAGREGLVASRATTRLIAEGLGLEALSRARLVAALSELLQEPAMAGESFEVRFCLSSRVCLELVVMISGQMSPASGLVIRDLVDSFDITGEADGRIKVRLGLGLPRKATPEQLEELAARLGGQVPFDPYDELRIQNEQLLGALEVIAECRDEIRSTSEELEDTNRGIVALHGQMEEQAMRLRESDVAKNRFLSFVSHKLRTPLSSIIALARLLVDRVDGDLNPEQTKQVQLIHQSANSLNALVNDLLDLVKVQAGRADVNVRPFSVAGLFSSLRGMMRPLATNPAVALDFEQPPEGLEICSDETKVGQILSNFISNALKFTEEGRVSVCVQLSGQEGEASFEVSDTGIGIAPEDQKRIFEEFAQIAHPIQRKLRGTGLGLPLSQRLAELLGGRVELKSEDGKGSTFSLVLPLDGAQAC